MATTLYNKCHLRYRPQAMAMAMAIASPMLQWLDLLHPFTFFLLFIFTVLFFLLRVKKPWSEKPYLPPSPPRLPVIGNLHLLGTLVHRSLRDLSEKYGSLMLLHMGYTPTLVVSSAEMAREITKTHDIAFANRPFTTAAKALLYECTDIGFAPYGEYWRQIRKIAVLDLFSVKRVQSFRYIREQEVSLMIEKISRSCATRGASINLSEMILALSNDVVSRCALGMKAEGEDGDNKFGELSREVMMLFGAFSFGDLFPWLGWMDVITGLVGKMNKVSRKLDIFFDQIIEEHIARRKHDDQDYRKDFVDLLLDAQKNEMLDINITRDNIKAIILDMFVGGTDTTSTTIEWAIAELVKNPNVMKKAREEVRRVVGKKSKIDEEDITQMDYLKLVIKEILRLHAPVPLLVPREVHVSTKIKNYDIPPNTRVIINAWAIQRDSKYWDKPEEFIPERFINNSIDFKGQDYEYIPFGSGRRGCPGMSFGLASVEFAVANLLYWFDWELPGDAYSGELDMTESFGLTVNKKTPLYLVPISQFPN